MSLILREALLAEMGVAVREDGGTVGVFSPKKVMLILLYITGGVCTATHVNVHGVIV